MASCASDHRAAAAALRDSASAFEERRLDSTVPTTATISDRPDSAKATVSTRNPFWSDRFHGRLIDPPGQQAKRRQLLKGELLFSTPVWDVHAGIPDPCI